MRTTLTIDDDLAGMLHKQSRELDKSFKEVVNIALRNGLSKNSQSKASRVVARPHDFGAKALGLKPGCEISSFNQLADELEIDDYLKKASRDDSARY